MTTRPQELSLYLNQNISKDFRLIANKLNPWLLILQKHREVFGDLTRLRLVCCIKRELTYKGISLHLGLQPEDCFPITTFCDDWYPLDIQATAQIEETLLLHLQYQTVIVNIILQMIQDMDYVLRFNNKIFRPPRYRNVWGCPLHLKIIEEIILTEASFALENYDIFQSDYAQKYGSIQIHTYFDNLENTRRIILNTVHNCHSKLQSLGDSLSFKSVTIEEIGRQKRTAYDPDLINRIYSNPSAGNMIIYFDNQYYSRVHYLIFDMTLFTIDYIC